VGFLKGAIRKNSAFFHLPDGKWDERLYLFKLGFVGVKKC
jgi:hypothetical protein